MAEVKMEDIIEYKKRITTNDPDTYVEAILKLEGLTENEVEEMRKSFNTFYKEVETIMHKKAAHFNEMG